MFFIVLVFTTITVISPKIWDCSFTNITFIEREMCFEWANKMSSFLNLAFKNCNAYDQNVSRASTEDFQKRLGFLLLCYNLKKILILTTLKLAICLLVIPKVERNIKMLLCVLKQRLWFYYVFWLLSFKH